LVKVEVEFKWKFSTFVMAGLASLVPFGPFIMEKKLKSEQLKAEAAELAMQKS
jgi:hypothetical protein